MDRYPYSIVWTPLPVLTWFIPIIGHTGIANSEGIIHDFGGSYHIAVDNFTFGRPTKFLKLDPEKAQSREWDDAIRVSACTYREQQHNLVINNCHSHVADTLNEMKYNGRTDYTQLDIFWMMTTRSQYVGFKGFIIQWGVFLLMMLIVIVIVSLPK